jgi:hypothetical protein
MVVKKARFAGFASVRHAVLEKLAFIWPRTRYLGRPPIRPLPEIGSLSAEPARRTMGYFPGGEQVERIWRARRL